MSMTDDIFDAKAMLDAAPIPYPRIWMNTAGIWRQLYEGANLEVQLEDGTWEVADA